MWITESNPEERKTLTAAFAGFGVEWSVGSVLIAEMIQARYRGRAAGLVQSSWAVGWGVAAIAFWAVYALVEPAMAWRILFASSAGVLIVAYTQIPITDSMMLVLGFPLGFFLSGIFSGMGAYLTELFPSRVRSPNQNGIPACMGLIKCPRACAGDFYCGRGKIISAGRRCKHRRRPSRGAKNSSGVFLIARIPQPSDFSTVDRQPHWITTNPPREEHL